MAIEIPLAQELATQLHWPHNVGIEFRPIQVGVTPGYLVWVDGLASAAALEASVLAALPRVPRPDPESTAATISLLRYQYQRDIGQMIDAVLAGSAALLAAGWDGALLLDTVHLPNHHSQHLSPNPSDDQFGRDLRFNLALLRKRLRATSLVARVVPLKRGRAGQVVLLAMEDRASPAVIRAVRRWAWSHVGEEVVQRGLLAGLPSLFGLIPRFSPERWPDKAAVLLETGHVALMVDRTNQVFVAPVTAAADVLSGSDPSVNYPLRRWLIRFRLILYFFVLFLPGSVVALLNYHTEMVPTSFLAAVSSARENAPFGIFFEVLFLELLVDLAREAALRLEGTLSVGVTFVGTVLLVMMGVLSGFFGPLAALAAALGALASLTLPGHVGTYMVRMWRYYLILAAVLFGFFGMAAGGELFLLMLCASRTWGVPFLGPSGWHLTAAELDAAQRPSRKGGKRRGPSRSAVR